MDTNSKSPMQEKLLNFYKENLGEAWTARMEEFLVSEEMETIRKTIAARRKAAVVMPRKEEMFSAFKLTPLNEVRVVVIGQDPYHTPGHAHGLAFSSKSDKTPPSLRNIFKEIEKDVFDGLNLNLGLSNDLTSWAEQGVLLINTALSVEKQNPGCHAKLWEPFTVQVMQTLSDYTGIVYLLWGGHAKSFKKYINLEQNYVLEAAHPSPFSASKFFGCRHFSKTNKILESLNGKEGIINWNNYVDIRK